MATTIDHLRSGVTVRVLRTFVDIRGAVHTRGERGVLGDIRIDWPQQEIVLTWVRNRRSEMMVLSLSSTAGPGNGRMHEYFAIEAEPEPARPLPSGLRGAVRTLSPPLLSGGQPLLSMDAADPVERIAALADHRRFDEARAALVACTTPPDEIARALGFAAERRVLEKDPAVYEWLRDHATNCWYTWGSQATSGGDGAARLLSIEPAMARFRALDEARRHHFAASDEGGLD